MDPACAQCFSAGLVIGAVSMFLIIFVLMLVAKRWEQRQ